MTVRTTQLDNGLTVATDSMESVESVSVGVWIGVGTRDEKPEINGVSHLLEHMAFKGTRRRSAQAIAEEIEAVGGHLTAYTSREHTAYFAKILRDDLPLAIDIIADILQNSVLDSEELARERAVIIQEIHQSRDTPDDVIFDHFQETAFPDQAIGRPVMGSADLIRNMPREALVDFMRGHYGASSMILTAAGRIGHDALVDMAQNAFGTLPAGSLEPRAPIRYVGGDYRQNRNLEQVHIVLGLEGVSYDDDRFFAMSVLSTLLGGGMSSRLFQEIREKRGLVYSIQAFHSFYSDAGVFGVYAGTGETEAEELVPLVCQELRKVAEFVTIDEVLRARAQLKASLLMALESTSSRAEQLARQLMVFGRPLTIPEIIDSIDAVDADAVMAAARHLIGGRPTFATLGPVSAVADYDAIVDSLKA
ncbi:MAG: insulinase family protein [Rhodospirillales bacterium]|nr:insulinase family protein [Rhodospirillales bacterium]